MNEFEEYMMNQNLIEWEEHLVELSDKSRPIPDWIDDSYYKNIYKYDAGLIIGSGKPGYEHKVSDYESFNGKTIACNTAFNLFNYDVGPTVTIWSDPIIDPRIVLYDKTIKLVVDPYEWKGDLFKVPGFFKGIRGYDKEKITLSFNDTFYISITGRLALNIAMLLGLNPIYLAGFHSNTEPYSKFINEYELLAEYAAINGIKVYVSDKDSSLTRFFEYKYFKNKHKKKPPKNI